VAPVPRPAAWEPDLARRVLLVIGQLQQGGAEGQLAALALGLPRSRYEPAVACLSEVDEPHGSRLRASGVRVDVFPRRTHADPARVVGLARLMGRCQADLIHSFLVGANVYAYAASRLAGRSRFIASSRTSMEIRGRAARRLHSWVFRHASAVIANSAAVADFTADYYGVARGRIRVVPNGVRLEAAGEREMREGLRREMGIPTGILLVGTLGRLSVEKNLPLLLKVAKKITGEFPNVRFVIAGDGPARASLEEAIRRDGLTGRVHLAGARADVPAFLSALDLFVLTSDTEGLPNAVMEAMGSALPVVATRVGGTHEVVQEGETGRLAPPGDAEALSRVLADLLGDEGARRRMGEAGRLRIAERFTMERMIENTCRVYDDILGGGVMAAGSRP